LDDKPAAQVKPNVIRKTELFSGDIFLKENSAPMRKDRLISRCLPEFTPITKSDSNIMDNKMRSQIALYLPSLVRMREWTLLYTIAKDGISYTTFYANVKDRDNTVILIKDTKGKVFGAYCSESWRKAMHFYGFGDSFVFNFD
jgi:TLD